MKITLQRINDAVRFEGSDGEGHTVYLDGNPEIGGEEGGIRPMQLLLMSLAGCSSMDVAVLLKKMRQPLADIRVTARGEREAGAVPAIFKKIHLHFTLKGDLDGEKAAKAIGLSVEKYCPVSHALRQTAAITWSYEIVRDRPTST